MRLFEILMMAANAIIIIKLVIAGHSRTNKLAEVSPEAENPWVRNPEVINPGMNNFWVRGSWAGCLQPAKQGTRSPAEGTVLPVLSMVFAIISMLSEGFRLFMVPAYLLTVFLLHGIARAITKKTAAYETAVTADTSVSNTSVRSKRHVSRKPGIFGTVILILIFAISVALAYLFPVIDLPEPAGPYPVGTKLAAFTDASRKEPHTVSGEHRKIPVQIWYPASDTAEKKRVNWLINKKMSRIFAECKKVPDIFGQLNLVKTNSYLDAGLSADKGKYPVILFSGGGAMFNGQNVIQMEELASHGYIVCAVGHAYDDFACTFPDGSVIPYDPEHLKALGNETGKAIDRAESELKAGDNDPEFGRFILRGCSLNNSDAITWSRDMSFAADELARLNGGDNNGMEDNTDNMFLGRLDMANLGVFGHSFGGAAAGETCLRDERFKAFINMDGSPFGTAVDNVIRQPFMILTVGKNVKRIISSGYCVDQKNFMTVYIEGSEHMNFSDFNIILPNIGSLSGILGSIGSDRQREIMNYYILAFFNKYLKGTTEQLIDSAASKYPEVMVEKR